MHVLNNRTNAEFKLKSGRRATPVCASNPLERHSACALEQVLLCSGAICQLIFKLRLQDHFFLVYCHTSGSQS